MKKIFKIMPLIIIISIIIISVIKIRGIMHEAEEHEKIGTKNCNIDINYNDYIKVEESLNIGEDEYYPSIDYYISPVLYSTDYENLIEEVKVFVDGKEIYNKYDENNNQNKDSCFYIDMNKIILYRIEPGKHLINIEYKINPKIINEYSNLSVLKIRNNKKFLDYKVNINFPREVSLLETDSEHARVKKIENNSYEINMTKTSKIIDKDYIELKLNRYIVKNPTIVDEQYNIINKINSEDNFAAKYLLILLSITIVLLIVVKLLTMRRVIYKKYIKSTKIVLEPIFAESLIDGKIGAKELIMTSMMDLIYRKKIDVIEENEKLKILSLEDVNKYEKEIIDLVFDGKSVTSFTELRKKLNNIEESVRFNEKFKEIKNDINKYFFDKGIYSKIGERVLYILRILALILILNFVPLTLSMIGVIEYTNMPQTILLTIFIGLVIGNFKKTKKRKSFENKVIYEEKSATKTVVRGVVVIKNVISPVNNIRSNYIKFKLIINLIMGGSLYIVSLLPAFESSILMSIGAVLILALNIISFKSSQTHCLTEEGMKEYNKAYGLKKYIKDFGLMEQREMSGIQVWDEYLIYACAFGISTKITGKINENALKINNFIKNFDNFWNSK